MTNSGPVRDGPTHAASAPDQTGVQAPLLKLEDFLPHRLNVLSSLVSQALTRVYGRHGIGIPEWRGLFNPPGKRGKDAQGGGAPPPNHPHKSPPPGGPPAQTTTVHPPRPPPRSPRGFSSPTPPPP